jgi:hypothetical protein
MNKMSHFMEFLIYVTESNLVDLCMTNIQGVQSANTEESCWCSELNTISDHVSNFNRSTAKDA